MRPPKICRVTLVAQGVATEARAREATILDEGQHPPEHAGPILSGLQEHRHRDRPQDPDYYQEPDQAHYQLTSSPPRTSMRS